MLANTHRRRLLATVATATALAATASPALAMPIDSRGGGGAPNAPEQVRVVRVQVDKGMDWTDAGIGAAGMLALVLIGYGGAHALATTPGRRSAAHS